MFPDHTSAVLTQCYGHVSIVVPGYVVNMPHGCAQHALIVVTATTVVPRVMHASSDFGCANSYQYSDIHNGTA